MGDKQKYVGSDNIPEHQEKNSAENLLRLLILRIMRGLEWENIVLAVEGKVIKIEKVCSDGGDFSTYLGEPEFAFPPEESVATVLDELAEFQVPSVGWD